MKKMILLMLLLSAALLACTGAAMADELTAGEAKAELFTEGALPQMQTAQTYSAIEFGDYIYQQLKNLSTEINVEAYGFTKDEDSLNALVAAYSDAINSHPDLFYVGSQIGYNYYESGTIAYLFPQYLYEGEDLQNRIAAFESSVSSIASYASRATTTVGKLMAVNDYFCVNFQYDTSLSIYRPDLLFSGGTGVCQAYMMGFAAVLDELGIENTYATSDAMNHTWNLVQLDGSWYHVDVTWNDPTPNMSLRACHNNFLLSDAGIGSAGHYSWSSAASAGNTKYDSAFWMDLNTPLGVYGDRIYYADAQVTNGERTIHCWTPSGTTDVTSYSIAFFDGTYIAMDGYSGIAADGEYVYYGALGSLYAYPVTGGEAEAFYHTGDDEMQIISCFLQGSEIRMLAMNLETSESETHTAGTYTEPKQLAASPTFVELTEGGELTIALTDAETGEAVTVEWDYDSEALTMGEDGVFTAVRPGCYTITASAEGYDNAQTQVVIHSEDCLVLPADLATIEAEAFSNTAAEEIVLPEGAVSIGEGAFAHCANLLIVRIPDSVAEIAEDAFDGVNQYTLTILCHSGSFAHEYALGCGMEFVLIP